MMPSSPGNDPIILQRSPHDEEPWADGADGEAGLRHTDAAPLRCKPSRYNIRAVTRDGRLVLWSSYRRSLSVFSASQRPEIEALLGRREMSIRPAGLAK